MGNLEQAMKENEGMNLDKLYKMQEELDNHILSNARKRNVVLSKEELLEKTILALLVEVGELANATRCFKYWSLKKPESKARILEELADMWHFYISIGNQIKHRMHKKYIVTETHYNFIVDDDTSTEIIFIGLYQEISMIGHVEEIENKRFFYDKVGHGLTILGKYLGFIDKEVEQAYLKKHEENYRRQAEGY